MAHSRRREEVKPFLRIDLHIHSKASDGKLSIVEIFQEAENRKIDFLSICDHDSINCQAQAVLEAQQRGIRYITGVELNVTFSDPNYQKGKTVALDFLGYQFDPYNKVLTSKLETIAKYRMERAVKILGNLNAEFQKENVPALTKDDFTQIEESVDGTLGRPHIADYLIKKGIVTSRQEAFDKYLVKCDAPKYPLYLEEAARLVRDAGGKLVLAHPNDPHGTSLISLSKALPEQTQIINAKMLPYIDGVECWHSRNTLETTSHYLAFAKERGLIATGGSDCHQKPVIMGTVETPAFVADQFQ